MTQRRKKELGRNLGPDLLSNLRQTQQNVRQLKGFFVCEMIQPHLFWWGYEDYLSAALPDAAHILRVMGCMTAQPPDPNHACMRLWEVTKLTYKMICNPQTNTEEHCSSWKVSRWRVMEEKNLICTWKCNSLLTICGITYSFVTQLHTLFLWMSGCGVKEVILCIFPLHCLHEPKGLISINYGDLRRKSWISVLKLFTPLCWRAGLYRCLYWRLLLREVKDWNSSA